MTRTSQAQQNPSFDPTKGYESFLADAKAGATQALAAAERLETFAVEQAGRAIEQSAQLSQSALREMAGASKAWREVLISATRSAEG